MKDFSKGICRWLYLIFAGLFLFSFTLILLNVIFNKAIYSYNTFCLILLVLLFLVLITSSVIFLRKRIYLLEKHYYKIVFLSCSFLFLVQLFFGFKLQFNPTWDLESIYQGAIKWVETGTFTGYTSATSRQDYFYIFPNNLGPVAFLALFFKLANLFGVTAYFSVGCIVNACLITLSLAFLQAICKRLFGVLGGLLSIVLFLLSLPFYFMAAVFYTDALSLMFPLAAFYGFLKAYSCQKKSSKLLLYVFSSCMCLVGALIKTTVLIFVIAAFICLALRRKWRELLIFAATAIAVIGTGFTLFYSFMYSSQLSREKADQMNMPANYWIDLAVHGTGRYNDKIYHMARNEEDPITRKEMLSQDIKERVKELGAGGIYDLFENKSARAFGDGTYALSDFLDDRPIKEGSFLSRFLLYDGEYYYVYSTIATAIFLAIQILMLLSVSFRQQGFKALIPQLCIFGIMLFLLFWEINSRYITTFVPFILLCAVNGVSRVIEKIDKTRP